MKFLFLSFLTISILLSDSNTNITESQPEILFEHNILLNKQEKRALIATFNRAVLYLEKEKYEKAIYLFKKSAKILKIESFLNIGIAYYKLNSQRNAYLYLKKIYDLKDLKSNNRYSYFSSAYYLYQITNDKKYLDNIINASLKVNILSEAEKHLVADTFILLKKYKKAIKLLKNMKYQQNLKMGLLYLKLRDYIQSKVYLDKAYEENNGDRSKNIVLWFKIFRDLKDNNLQSLIQNLVVLEDRKKIFKFHNKLKLELFFNKNKFRPSEYLKSIQDFSYDKKLDLVYYFAPFIFEEANKEEDKALKGFITKDKNSLYQLDTLIKYNKDFLDIIKVDPIKRVQLLQSMIDKKYDTNSFEYYNLALSYAQVYDYNNAFKYFNKAYNLDHANKLYSVMTILTAKRLNKKLSKRDDEFLRNNISSNNGQFIYLGKYLYKIFEVPSTKLDPKTLTNSDKKSIFFRSLLFLDKITKGKVYINEPLFVEFAKDPLVSLLKLVTKRKNENNYLYKSRLQDSLPKIYNNNFLNTSLVTTDYYFDILRALGLFNRINFNIPNNFSPSYLRAKAIVNLYQDNPLETIKLMKDIQKKYNYKSVNSNYILIAAYLSSGKKELAYLLLSELEFIYYDNDARFFSGVKLISDLKVETIENYFKYKLKGKLIDFKLKNFDNYLESL